MNIEFITAKNGEETVKINSILLHSLYNPQKESENFVNNLNINYNPEYIVITEPGLSYCCKFFRQKFPNSKLIAIRYSNIFENYGNFDFILKFDSGFEENLQKIIPENKMFNTLFLKWEPSSKVFSETDTFVWTSIKNILQFNKTLLITRQHFEKKWLINTCNFVKYATNLSKINKKIHKPVLICASGPSLKNSLDTIKKYQNQIFIICLSSAISVLNRNNITPNLYLSTDGGFWANFHLRKINKNIPLGITPESFCNKKILQEQKIFPLIYPDGYSSKLKNLCDCKFYNAERNGTVSGTALKLAETLTDKEIFFAGLDLSSNKGFQHTQPNELKLLNLTKYNRINTEEKQEYSASMNTESLKIYENWFKNSNVKNKTFRIIEESAKKNNFNYIKDISVNDFSKFMKTQKASEKVDFSFYKREQKNINNECLDFYNFIQAENKSGSFNKNIFVLDYVSLERNFSNSNLVEKLKNENESLLKKIKMILG